MTFPERDVQTHQNLFLLFKPNFFLPAHSLKCVALFFLSFLQSYKKSVAEISVTSIYPTLLVGGRSFCFSWVVYECKTLLSFHVATFIPFRGNQELFLLLSILLDRKQWPTIPMLTNWHHYLGLCAFYVIWEYLMYEDPLARRFTGF